MLGYTQKEVLGKDQHLLFHHHKPSNEFYDVIECPIYLTLQDFETRYADEYFIRRDGTFSRSASPWHLMTIMER